MTEQEKQLLIKALCGLLPYKAKVEIDGYYTHILEGIDFNTRCTISTNKGINYPLRLVKPYLRPLESMTEEEINEFILISDTTLWLGNQRSTCILSIEQINWLNSKYFDYYGLIPMGLALPATKEMYK